MRSSTLGSSICVVVILTFMALAFRNVTSAPLENLDVVAPDGTVVGVIGENGSGKSRLLRLAAGMDTPTTPTVKASGHGHWPVPHPPLHPSPPPPPPLHPTLRHHH